VTIFAKRLKTAMQNAGMTQADLSAATGIGKSSISQYLSGKNVPRQKTIRLFAEVLNVEESWLDGTTEDEPADQEEAELILNSKRITVDQAAKIMGVSKDFIRVGLQRGQLPFGVAVKMSSVYTYYINPKQFFEYVGGLT